MSTTGIVAASERNWDSALARTNSYVIRPFHNFVKFNFNFLNDQIDGISSFIGSSDVLGA